ncbi:MAG TPA: putative toxin-antitoxin system toxin component, PIN family [Candidatus Humimicrobiaceae bacterium]
MIIVVDTNIIISGLIKPYSDAAIILHLILAGRIKIAYDFRVLNEYETVLKRKKFNFHPQEVEPIIKQIKDEGIYVDTVPLKISLPDSDDNQFLEIAISGKINFLVTGEKNIIPISYVKVSKYYHLRSF